jgi:hypothetical protein
MRPAILVGRSPRVLLGKGIQVVDDKSHVRRTAGGAVHSSDEPDNYSAAICFAGSVCDAGGCFSVAGREAGLNRSRIAWNIT